MELGTFTRLSKSNLRGAGLRAMFAEIPTLMGVAAPCMLMSPTTVAQYLQPVADQFDLVIFDEASQMSTAEAVGSIAVSYTHLGDRTDQKDAPRPSVTHTFCPFEPIGV